MFLASSNLLLKSINYVAEKRVEEAPPLLVYDELVHIVRIRRVDSYVSSTPELVPVAAKILTQIPISPAIASSREDFNDQRLGPSPHYVNHACAVHSDHDVASDRASSCS